MENFHISSTVLNVSTKQSFSAWTDTKRADRSCRKSPTFLHFQAKKKKKNPTASSQIPPYPAIYSVWNLSCYCLSEFEKKKKKNLLPWKAGWHPGCCFLRHGAACAAPPVGPGPDVRWSASVRWTAAGFLGGRHDVIKHLYILKLLRETEDRELKTKAIIFLTETAN